MDHLIAYEIVAVSGLAVCFFGLVIRSRELDELLAVSVVICKVFAGKGVEDDLFVYLGSEYAFDIGVERNSKFVCLALKPVDICAGTVEWAFSIE